MQLETFRGRELSQVLAQVRKAMGEDAMIIRTRMRNIPGEEEVEMVVAAAEEVESFRRKLDGGIPHSYVARDGTLRVRPKVIALVGPPGAGKTTTMAKLALNSSALGARNVGFLTLDTYRAGAIEELQTYAEITGIPMEVVYHRRDLPGAMRRLRSCSFILVDTPGRSLSSLAITSEWSTLLAEVDPDEVHLVLPAGLRIDVSRSVRAAFEVLGTTHVLFSKVDEVPGDRGLAELADALGLPVRWIADGQSIPDDLKPAEARILASLGRESAMTSTSTLALG